MSLKLAAVIPHPPLLISAIGKENVLRLEKTKNSYGKIAEALSAEKIETIVIVSSHGPIRPGIWQINISDEFEINFEEFGDFTAKMKISGDLELAQNIREDLIEDSRVQAVYQPILDYGCGVPLYSLLANLPGKSAANGNARDIEIAPIYVSGAGLKEHFSLGEKISARLAKGRKKIAVFASGDLSHALEKKSPAGFSPRAAKFDQKIMEALQNKTPEEILNLDENLIAEVQPCGLKAISLLLGILNGNGYDIASTDYESPFGVGYLSMILRPLPK
jgi:aromatic ring-opening dioxygenase LigB subunit